MPVKKQGSRKKKPEFKDKTKGPLRQRRYGVQIDDDVVVYIVGGDTLRVVKGKVLDHRKELQLVDDEGFYHRISYDWITDLVVLAHNRPHPSDDPEYKKKSEKKPVKKPPPDHAYS